MVKNAKVPTAAIIIVWRDIEAHFGKSSWSQLVVRLMKVWKDEECENGIGGIVVVLVFSVCTANLSH